MESYNNGQEKDQDGAEQDQTKKNKNSKKRKKLINAILKNILHDKTSGLLTGRYLFFPRDKANNENKTIQHSIQEDFIPKEKAVEVVGPIPNEIAFEIFKYLNNSELAQLALVSKFWEQAVSGYRGKDVESIVTALISLKDILFSQVKLEEHSSIIRQIGPKTYYTFFDPNHPDDEFKEKTGIKKIFSTPKKAKQKEEDKKKFHGEKKHYKKNEDIKIAFMNNLLYLISHAYDNEKLKSMLHNLVERFTEIKKSDANLMFLPQIMLGNLTAVCSNLEKLNKLFSAFSALVKFPESQQGNIHAQRDAGFEDEVKIDITGLNEDDGINAIIDTIADPEFSSHFTGGNDLVYDKLKEALQSRLGEIQKSKNVEVKENQSFKP